MKILLIHNTYQQNGGEDSVLASEQKLLRQHGHQCEMALLSNDTVDGFWVKANTAFKTPWSKKGHSFATQAIQQFQPDIVHVHNFFPLLTPSIYDACIEAGVPVVQTLHNYRTICPGALLMRDGEICEKCITDSPYQAIWHRCYRNSFPGSWAVARMVAYHRRKQTWLRKVDRFIALTQFGKKKFIEADFPAEKIVVKPNFCVAAGPKDDVADSRRKGAVFVGRLSAEKGVATMLEAWDCLEIPLRVAGGGPLLADRAGTKKGYIEFLGQIDGTQVVTEMAQAAFLVMPSEWYEGFPMVIVESFAYGLPVIASRLGAMAEIVEDGVTGLHFEPGNAVDLAQKVQWLHEHPHQCQQMGKNAKRVYTENYTPKRNYHILLDTYKQIIDTRKEDH